MYVTHSLEEYQEVMRLREKGLSLIETFSCLSERGFNISYGTISDWIYTNKKPFREKKLNKILPQSEFLTVEKSYILGVLCGDGYIRVHKSGTGYLVGLDVCDEDFADEFRRCLQKVYGLSASKKKRYPKSTNFTNKPKPRYCINLTSKLVVMDLFTYNKSFKTKEWEIPEEILKSSLEIKSAFLRGLFDSEGSVSLKKPFGVCLSICSGNSNPMLKIKDILKKDFNINLVVIDNDPSLTILKSSGYKNIKNFYDYINFTIKRKRDPLNEGLSTYTRKGVRRYSLEFKHKALEMLNRYQDPIFVAGLLGISNSNIYDWKNGRYLVDIKEKDK